jgi:hypothetical protein
VSRLVAVLCVVLWALPGVARADVASCVAAAEEGQVQRDERALAAARTSFLACADASCPAAVRKECASWLSDVDARIPTLVIAVRDARGHDVAGATVWLDEAELEPSALGRELDVEPGRHRLVARTGEREAQLEITASEREKGRLVTLVLADPPAQAEEPAPEPAAEPAGRPWLGPVVTLSAGALRAGGAGLLTLRARADADDLRGRCAPACSAGEVGKLESRLRVADVLLITGAAAVVAGAAWWLWPRRREPARAAVRVRPTLAVGGRAAPQLLGLEGAF